MESILDLEPSEIKQIKRVLKEKDESGNQLHSVFVQYAPKLFENCFLMILSSGAKMEGLSLLKEMAESQDDGLQVKIDTLLDITLNICSQIIKQNVRGTSEFTLILNDLGVPEASHVELCQVF